MQSPSLILGTPRPPQALPWVLALARRGEGGCSEEGGGGKAHRRPLFVQPFRLE